MVDVDDIMNKILCIYNVLWIWYWLKFLTLGSFMGLSKIIVRNVVINRVKKSTFFGEWGWELPISQEWVKGNPEFEQNYSLKVRNIVRNRVENRHIWEWK